MKKDLREVEALVQIVDEYASVQKNIANLPCGYISVKQISGHTYCYRQWREGKRIISQYVPDALLSSVKRKIAVRKENEALLKVIKKDLKKATRKVVKSGLLTELLQPKTGDIPGTYSTYHRCRQCDTQDVCLE